MERLSIDKPTNKQTVYTVKIWLAIWVSLLFLICYFFGWPFFVSQLLGNVIENFFWLNTRDKELVSWLGTLALIYFLPNLNGKSAVVIGMVLMLINLINYQFEKIFVSDELQCQNEDHPCQLIELATGKRTIIQDGELRPAGSRIIGKPSLDDLIAYDPRVEAPLVHQIFIKTKAECETFQFFKSIQSPTVFYSYGLGNKLELFDGEGANPRTGQKSEPITKEIVETLCADLNNRELLDQQQRVKENALKKKSEEERNAKVQALKNAEIERLRHLEAVEKLAEKRRNEEVKKQQAEDSSSPFVIEENDPFGGSSESKNDTIEPPQKPVEAVASLDSLQNCASLLKQENATIFSACLDAVECQNTPEINKLEMPVKHFRNYYNNQKKGCIAYAGSENPNLHQQTLSCLVNLLGNGYYLAQECSGYVVEGASFYEVNPV